jgi:hypothetical protein
MRASVCAFSIALWFSSTCLSANPIVDRYDALISGKRIEATVFEATEAADLNGLDEAQCWDLAVNARSLTTIPRQVKMILRGDESVAVNVMSGASYSAMLYSGPEIHGFSESRVVTLPGSSVVQHQVSLSRAPLPFSVNSITPIHLGASRDHAFRDDNAPGAQSGPAQVGSLSMADGNGHSIQLTIDESGRPSRWIESSENGVHRVLQWLYHGSKTWPYRCIDLRSRSEGGTSIARYEISSVSALTESVPAATTIGKDLVVVDQRMDIVQPFELKAQGDAPLTLEDVLNASETKLAAGAARRVVPSAAGGAWTSWAAPAAAVVAAIGLVLVVRRMQTRLAR